MAQLVVTTNTDFRGGPAETNIDGIYFLNAATATFSYDQFGPGLIANDSVIAGSAGVNTMRITFASGGNFSAAGWQFQSWSQNDRIFLNGGSGANDITGSSRSDTITNGGGLDHIYAGKGDDVVDVNAAFSDFSVLDGGDGTDLVEIVASGQTSLRNVAMSNVEAITFTHTGQILSLNDDQIGKYILETVTSAGDSTLRVYGKNADLRNVEFRSWGPASHIEIYGATSGNNLLFGSDQKDYIEGGDFASSSMSGGLGADYLRGGLNDDGFFYDEDYGGPGDLAAGETIRGDGGIDTIYTGRHDLDFTQADVTSVEQLTYRYGGEVKFGSDMFGGDNITTVTGGDGLDTLTVIAVNNAVNLKVVTFVDWTNFKSNIPSLEFTDRINILGSSGDDSLTGSDFYTTYDGGAGADTMTGGTRDDTYIVDTASDRVIEAANGGSDTIYSSSNFALAAGQSVEMLRTDGISRVKAINLTGNEFDQRVSGNAGANTLDGKGGADTMTGYGGNDIYKVDDAGDVLIEVAGAGSDTVYASTSFTLAAGVSVEQLRTNAIAGLTAINLTGNEIAQALYGNAGANILTGAGGADTMTGYGGNDTYRVDSASDSVIEAAGGGSDTVSASASFTLAAGQSVEQLRANLASATTAINLTGNEVDNTILGNAGANKLNGGAGKDLLDARDDDAQDIFVFSAVAHSTSTGRDTVLHFESGEDKFDFTVKPSFVSFVVGGTLNDGANFDAELKAAVDQALRIDGAVLFDPDKGGLGGNGHSFLVVDVNHNGVYNAGLDYVVEVGVEVIIPPGGTGPLGIDDFM